jgi:tRNA-splicing ligase RtcB
MQMESDVADMKEEIAAALFKSIPVGVGSESLLAATKQDLEDVLARGMDWSIDKACLSKTDITLHLAVIFPLTMVQLRCKLFASIPKCCIQIGRSAVNQYPSCTNRMFAMGIMLGTNF